MLVYTTENVLNYLDITCVKLTSRLVSPSRSKNMVVNYGQFYQSSLLLINHHQSIIIKSLPVSLSSSSSSSTTSHHSSYNYHIVYKMDESIRDLQVVIIIDYDDGRLFPLTEGLPKCLLPVANRRLLAYQLDMLTLSGAIDVLIAAPKEYEEQIVTFLKNDYQISKLSVQVVPVDDMIGSVDGLRALADKVRGDFICLGSDVLSQVSLGELVKVYRTLNSDVAMILSAVAPDEPDKKGGPKKIKIDEEDQEYIGICDKGRVVMKSPGLELDGKYTISKPLLNKFKSMTIRNDIIDVGVYVMSHWILDFVLFNRKLSSIRTDLIPYLVQRQFQSKEYLMKMMPSLQKKNKPLSELHLWFQKTINASNDISGGNVELVDVLSNSFLSSSQIQSTQIGASTSSFDILTEPTVAVEETNSDDYLENINGNDDNDDLLQCYALVYNTNGSIEYACKSNDNQEVKNKPIILQRVTNIQTYMNLNRDVPTVAGDNDTIWLKLKGYQKQELSMIGESCEMGEKVIIKQCSIGNNCQFGSSTRVNASVIFDNVIIGEGCTIQNSVICSGAIIENSCNINECYIGCGTKVPQLSKIKNESLQRETA